MFRTPTKPVQTGNWQIAVTCSSGHRTYKDQMHENDPYECGQSVAEGKICGKPV